MCYHCGGNAFDFSTWEIHSERATSECSVCGRVCCDADMTRINNKYVCVDCSRDFVKCDDCGELGHYDDMIECVAGDENKTYFLCSNCIGGIQIAEVEAFC